MTAIAQLRCSHLSSPHLHRHLAAAAARIPIPNSISFPSNLTTNLNLSLRSNRTTKTSNPTFLCFSSGDGGSIGNTGGSGGGGGRDWSNNNPSGGDSNDDSSSSFWETFGVIGMFIRGWKSRVGADPQFPFKVLMEEVVGVTSCVLGDMASRPNFGLNELDFVFSTLIVGSILNFTLMYLLAPTLGGATSTLPGIFSSCPTSHMFEPGSFGVMSRCGTFVYKGLLFAGAGFVAGLVGTAISNGLIAVRKKMDPEFETPNKAPPTLLNAVTWALHMGLSSNFRYQTLNGIESVLANAVAGPVFKSSVVALRCANNVLGGMSFVVLARLTGSQSVGEKKEVGDVDVAAINGSGSSDEKEKLVEGLPNNQST